MMARGDQVRLPHGRGVGLVIECDDGMVSVFIGRDSWGHAKLEEYVECELMLTGRHFSKPAREGLRERQAKVTR
jgi:hypothetical protein